MTMKKTFLVGLYLLLASSLVACGGRVPTAKSAQSITRNYFSHYGSRYKKSIFGTNKVKRVEVNRIEDLSLHLAEIEAFVTLKDGTMTRVLLNVKNNPPFGWSVLSWEMLDLR